jgi:RNA polymerase sigma-70 factor (ECF subfamily)
MSLAAAFVQGDATAASALVRAVGGTVLGAVRVILGPTHIDLDDAVQDALIGFLEGVHRFRGECTVPHFAGRVAVLTAMATRRRQQSRERWILSDEDEERHVPAPADASPLVRLEAARHRAALRSAIDELPAPIAEAITLHLVLGYTVQEVAAATVVPVNTVWSRLRIGKERMRARLAMDAVAPDCASRLSRATRLARDAVKVQTPSSECQDASTPDLSRATLFDDEGRLNAVPWKSDD